MCLIVNDAKRQAKEREDDQRQENPVRHQPAIALAWTDKQRAMFQKIDQGMERCSAIELCTPPRGPHTKPLKIVDVVAALARFVCNVPRERSVQERQLQDSVSQSHAARRVDGYCVRTVRYQTVGSCTSLVTSRGRPNNRKLYCLLQKPLHVYSPHVPANRLKSSRHERRYVPRFFQWRS